MAMVAFFLLFPEIAKRETRELTVLPPGFPSPSPRIPPGQYAFVELFCVEPVFDCRRVMIKVICRERRAHLATINHAFEPPPKGDIMEEEGQTFLDPLNTQSEFSADFLDLFLDVVLPSPDYAKRLERHYHLVKSALSDPHHPVHARISAKAGDVPPGLPGVPPGRRGLRKKWR
jgi:hypothetical protein